MAESADDIEDEPNIRMAACFDHEEIGSVSVVGAASNLMEHVLKRCTLALDSEAAVDIVEVAIRKSFLISADQAHACHPNYAFVSP